MALKGSYVSIKTLIAKIYRDLQFTEEEHFVDIIEWCAEALDHIHVNPQYVSTPLCFEVDSYKTELPCDFIALDQISYMGENMVASNNSFGFDDTTVPGRYYTPYPAYSYNVNKIKNVLFIDPNSTNYFRSGHSFKIENGWLKTSFKEGQVSMVYLAHPMDEEGYPLIPDEVSFKEALYWYCNYKYSYAKARLGELATYFYEDAYAKWQYYCNQAGAEALMPTLTQLEGMKRMYLSLIPKIDSFKRYFNNI